MEGRSLYEDTHGDGHAWWHMRSVRMMDGTRMDRFACVGCGAFTRSAVDRQAKVKAPYTASGPCPNRERSLVELVMGS